MAEKKKSDRPPEAKTTSRAAGNRAPKTPAPKSEAKLDNDIQRLLVAAVDVRRLMDVNVKALSRKAKLSERGLNIISMVAAGLDRPSMLIEYFGVLPSTITAETEKLVVAGLLERRPVSSDRRAIQLALTKRGRAIRHEALAVLNSAFRALVAQVSPSDLEHCIETLATIGQSLTPKTPISRHGTAPSTGNDAKPQATKPAKKAASRSPRS